MLSAKTNTLAGFLIMLSCALFAQSMWVQPVFAKAVNFAAGGGLNYKQAKIGFINRQGTAVANKEPTLLNLEGFFALAVKKFYFTVNADFTLLPDEETKTAAAIDTDESISRYDFAMTAGFNITKSFSLFGGLLYGSTDRDVVVTDTTSDTTISDETMSMSEFGPYLGLNYTFYFKNHMSLGFNGAYAFMSGEQTWGQSGFDPEVSYKGDTQGTSLGVKFSGPMGRIASYYVGYKNTQYKFETDDSQFTTDENFQTLSAGVTFYF
ncbi:MAG: hypothetical protein LJE85_13535 [Gammaproteobacteria bacterium]|nr:hypothetical protein [Gammaproteobacteria bacterium]